MFYRKIVLLTISLVSLLLSYPKANSPLGTNVQWLGIHSAEWPFVDAMKNADGWYGQYGQNDPWVYNDTAMKVDSNGYPIRFALGQSAAVCMLFHKLDGHYPSGQYLLLYEGSGTIYVDGDGYGAGNDSAKVYINVTPTNEGLFLYITQTDPLDPIRNIRLIMPGYHDSYKTQIFHPDFLAIYSPFRAIRFMNWFMTQSSVVEEWADRATTTYFSQGTQRGVAYEYMIALCNELHADAWINIPHKASDNFVTQIASLFRDSLATDLKLYLEYSNEVFNPDPDFQQHYYARQQGLSLGLSTDSLTAANRFYSRRCVEIFSLFEQAYGTTQRFVRILGTQTGNMWATNEIVNYNNAYLSADAIAMGGYFMFDYDSFADSAYAESLKTLSVEAVLDSCTGLIETLNGYIQEVKGVADAKSLDLIAYEGGQHLTGFQDFYEDPILADLFRQANEHDSIYSVYMKLFHDWDSITDGGLFMHFTGVQKPMPWGNFGSLQYMDQDIEDAPKYKAQLDYIKQTTSIITISNFKKTLLFTTLPGGFEIYDLRGRLLANSASSKEDIRQIMERMKFASSPLILRYHYGNKNVIKKFTLNK